MCVIIKPEKSQEEFSRNILKVIAKLAKEDGDSLRTAR